MKTDTEVLQARCGKLRTPAEREALYRVKRVQARVASSAAAVVRAQEAHERARKQLVIEEQRELDAMRAADAAVMSHVKDADCTVGENGCCTGCGVHHGDPCICCGGRGFHAEGCDGHCRDCMEGGRPGGCSTCGLDRPDEGYDPDATVDGCTEMET